MYSVKNFQWWGCAVWSSGTEMAEAHPDRSQENRNWGLGDRLWTHVDFDFEIIWEGTRYSFFLCVDSGSMSLWFWENVLRLEKMGFKFGSKPYVQVTLICENAHSDEQEKNNNAILSQEASVSLWKFKLTQSSKLELKKNHCINLNF